MHNLRSKTKVSQFILPHGTEQKINESELKRKLSFVSLQWKSEWQ